MGMEVWISSSGYLLCFHQAILWHWEEVSFHISLELLLPPPLHFLISSSCYLIILLTQMLTMVTGCQSLLATGTLGWLTMARGNITVVLIGLLSHVRLFYAQARETIRMDQPIPYLPWEVTLCPLVYFSIFLSIYLVIMFIWMLAGITMC
jgi:hypothetical protein